MDYLQIILVILICLLFVSLVLKIIELAMDIRRYKRAYDRLMRVKEMAAKLSGDLKR